jgi:hypothetical protein
MKIKYFVTKLEAVAWHMGGAAPEAIRVTGTCWTTATDVNTYEFTTHAPCHWNLGDAFEIELTDLSEPLKA